VTTDPTSGAKPANEVIPDLDPDSKPANGVIPDSNGDPQQHTATASASKPCRELIEQAPLRGRNAKRISQGLVDDHGFTGSYQNVKRFIHKPRGSIV
jgi:hypothetical protein